MGWTSILTRGIATLATVFAFLTLPIIMVSALSDGDLITLGGGILIFAASITAALVIIGIIWAFKR